MAEKIFLKDARTQCLIEFPWKEPIQIYLCGPTLYNDLHIGNIRNIVIFDALVSFLRQQNHTVQYMQNLTDVAEQIQKKAQTEKTTEKAIVDLYHKKYLQLLNDLEVKVPELKKVSECKKDIENFVFRLFKKGQIIERPEALYFDLKPHLSQYGIFKKHAFKLNNLASEKDFAKANFSVWKKATKSAETQHYDYALAFSALSGQPGRPGWHTECAALVSKYLSAKFTIHGGGKDLVFPHHENERIQLLALTQKEPIKVWLQNGFINFKNIKISKSQPKFSKQFLANQWLQYYSANATKFWLLHHHYSIDIELNLNEMSFYQTFVKKLIRSFAQVETYLVTVNLSSASLQAPLAMYQKFIHYLAQDFNTPAAIDWIMQKTKELNKHLQNQKIAEAALLKSAIIQALKIANITIVCPSLTQADKIMIRQWQAEMANHNYAVADQLREQLIRKKFL